jgi:general nucleoside transport system permease protein
MLQDIAFSSIRIATPLVLAALGGLYTFQAGILNIALDGFMIVAAFAAVGAAYATGSLAVGVLAGVAASVGLAAVLATFNLKFRAHIFIAGIAVTFLAYGLTALLLKSVFNQDGVFASPAIPVFPAIRIPGLEAVPVLGPILSGHTLLVYVAYLLVPVVSWTLYRTRWGLRVRMIGEAEDAARAAGVDADRVKVETMLISGLFCGLAGAYLSLGYVSLFAKEMTAERGLIALAAIFFAKGRPGPTTVVALFFGVATALAVRLPEVTGVAPQLLQIIPYLATILALVAVGVRANRGSQGAGWRFDP